MRAIHSQPGTPMWSRHFGLRSFISTQEVFVNA
jgi:hypothetical protein